MTLINAVNNAQAALQKAEKDLKDKEDAYNNCLKDVARICKEAAQLKLAIDSCNHAWGRIQEVTKAITGSSANPQNSNPKGTASAEAIAKATQEAGKAREALNKGDYAGAEQHARNADNLRMEADKTKGLEEGLGRLRDSETSLEKKLEDAKKNHAGNYDQVQKDIDKLKADVKEMENAIAKNDLTTAGRIHAASTKEAGQLSKAIDKAIIDADIAKKRQEDYVRRNTPKPQPKLGKPINPDDQQLKFFARTLVLEKLYRDEAIRRANGRECDCTVKALGLANKSNNAAGEIIGNLGVSIAFAPMEVFPGFSLATRLGIGTAKALGSALYGGQDFPEELAKNLFGIIGGEIFPNLTGSDFAGNRLNELANGGLGEIMKNDGVRAISWAGKTTLDLCGGVEVQGKTTLLFNPNTGWVTMIIKIDDCDNLVVVKYKVNADGTPVNNTISVTTIK
jgi:hypothetical protein